MHTYGEDNDIFRVIKISNTEKRYNTELNHNSLFRQLLYYLYSYHVEEELFNIGFIQYGLLVY